MRFSLFLVIGLLCCCWGATPAMAQPINDNCADSGLFEVFVGPNAYTNVASTTDGTQTGCFFSNDVWFQFTPVNSNNYVINTCGSTYDTEIQVFDGILCPDNLNASIACNDDSCGLQSSVQVALIGGVTYMIRAGSFSAGTFGAATLTITELVAAANDECVGATPALLGLNPLDTTGATTSADPVNAALCAGTTFGAMTRDVWFTYTPAGTTLQVSTCNIAGDTDILVYQGGACGALIEVGCNGDGPGCAAFSSNAVVPVTAGAQCVIRIGSWSAAGPAMVGQFLVNEPSPENCADGIDNDLDGLVDCADTVDCPTGTAPCIENCIDGIDNDGDLQVDCADIDCAGDPACAAAGNDFCGGALPILCNDIVIGNTAAATPDVQPFCGTSDGTAGGLWYSMVGNGDQVTLTTCNPGTTYDTKIRVWEGTCGAQTCVAGNDDASCALPLPLPSRVVWLTTPGTNYLILVHGFGGASGTFEMSVACLTPGVEDCVDGLDNDLDGLIDCADAVDCGGLPQCNEALNCGDAIDNDVDGLTDCQDTVDCPTGVPPCIPPANDSCLTPATLVVGANPYDTTLASDSIEPDSGCPTGSFWGAMSQDVWWIYTATTTGPHRVSTCGTGHDSDIEVYETTPLDPCDTTQSVGCSGDSCGLQSQVDWSATAGTTYVVRLGSWGAGTGFIGTLTFVVGGPEDCFDLVDNDFDGLTDCLDPDCALVPACQENCTDGIDNDADGFIDCADDACACTGSCPPPIPGDECCTALPVVAGANAFSTVGMTTSADIFNPGQCAGTAFGSNENDIWLSFTASITGDAFWDTCDAASFDTDVTIYEGSNCLTKVQIACNGDGVGLAGCQIFYSAGQFPITAGSTYLIRIGGFGAGLVGPGTLTIAETCSAAVANLTGSADCVSGNVSLAWDPAGFSSYDIARDSVVIATALPAGTTSYVDTGVANGTYLYDVIGNCAGGGGATSSVSVTVAAYGGEQDLVVRGETAAGLVDSVAALTAELTALGRTFVIWDGSFALYPCNTAPFEIIWQMNGTFPNYRCVNGADGVALQSAHLAGVGLYTECGDQWGFCAQGTAFETFDGVAVAADGNDGFTSMDGFDSLLGLDQSALANIPYTQDQAANDWTDQITVAASEGSLSAAAQVWALDDALGAPYTTGLYGTGIAPAGNIISQSWEFGGFGGDKNALASSYVAALGGGVALEQFKRGDCNIDGLLNIADAIFGLGALFPPGGGVPNDPQCDDSCDSNDDGSMNIADMITILGNLFPPGGGPPTVIPPPFGVCGADPTSDAIDCASYPTCP